MLMTNTIELDRPQGGGRRSLVPGEFLLTSDDFQQIAAMLHADAGISLPESKATLVYSRLAKRVRALGLENFRDYCSVVAGCDGVGERQKMLASLTTNVTHFFREPHHFQHLKGRVLPALLGAAKRGGRIRIWSAGCSSGQEPFSIALTIFALMPNADAHDIKVLATDIDPNMVEHGRKATYSDALLGAVPVALRNQYFASTQANGEKAWTATEQLRKLVAFRELNLNGPWPMTGLFQAIFCRNVVIYFDERTQQVIWNRFAPLLTPGGWLYLGHSERVTGSATSAFASEGITTYRLRERAP
jgi:chemotaxis protein methyltransferase CheR